MNSMILCGKYLYQSNIIKIIVDITMGQLLPKNKKYE